MPDDVPSIIASQDDFKKLQEKLNNIEETVENTNAEIVQRLGKKAGRDVGIVYGFAIGIFIVMVVSKILPLFQHYLK
jgi:tetrahydromethanopterin S-methyltransferase subunit G